jgi:hypothetical protein
MAVHCGGAFCVCCACLAVCMRAAASRHNCVHRGSGPVLRHPCSGRRDRATCVGSVRAVTPPAAAVAHAPLCI